MKILAFPKYGNTQNPVLYNLNKYLENDKEIFIDEFKLYKPFIKKYDIFHIHWPDYFFVKSLFSTILRVCYFLTIVFIFKILGTKIIWTIHNLQPHNNYHPKLNKLVMNIFTRYLDGIITMSKESYDLAIKKYPNLKDKTNELIYHGLYENYQNSITQAEARKFLDISLNKKVLLFFGRIDKYKNVLILIEEFKKLEEDKYILIIAGKIVDKELEQQIYSAIKNVKNIKLFCRFIEDKEVQYFFNASDIVVLPFTNILNSGSVMLALTFKKKVLCPEIGTLKELKFFFPNIFTYEKFTLCNIEQNINKKIQLNEIDNYKFFDNKYLSQKLKNFYSKVFNA